MKTPHSLHEFMPYGAPDLMVAQRPDLSRALVVASSATAGLFLLLAMAMPLVPKPVAPVAEVPPAIDLFRQPMLPEQKTPPAAAAQIKGSTKPFEQKFLPPRLVKEESEKLQLPTEYEGYREQLQKQGGEGQVQSPPQPPAAVWDTDDPVVFPEVLPTAVVEVKPEYPSIARDALVDGQVIVLVLVGRDGRVREAKLDQKRHVPMLDAVALEAARKWVFSPATVGGHPVAVWTAIPFNFRLY